MSIKKKICLLGSYGVGKTSLVRRFVYKKFEEKYLSTIGVHISKKKVEIKKVENGNVEIELFIWDIANIEKFDSIIKNYLRGAHGAIVVLDVSRPNTYLQIVDYVKKFRELNNTSKLVFVGNKIDLVDMKIFDNAEIIQSLHEFNCDIFYTSAKTGENVEEIFNNIASKMI